MEYNVDTVATKMILVIAVLSGIMAVASVPLFMLLAANPDSLTFAAVMGIRNPEAVTINDTIPFAAGISAVAAVNIAKVLLLKRAVKNSLERESEAAKFYLKGQSFIRLFAMAIVLLAVGFLHANATNYAGNPQYVNFMGAFFGVLIFPITSHSMRFFFRDALRDNPELLAKNEKSTTQDAIDKLKAIGADKEDKHGL
ncbi:MAG: hypothetical protein FWF77_10490 [Defluviitaleaceae bacterium]|nr:hypothetical protein [Defluviitaleaceae bacterium]